MSHSFLLRLAGAATLSFAALAPLAAEPQNQASSAATAEQGQDAAKADGEAKKPKLICKTVEASESRMKAQKVCMTREQWRQAEY